jgi:hypothetical protein
MDVYFFTHSTLGIISPGVYPCKLFSSYASTPARVLHGVTFTAALLHVSSSPMSRRYSRAAIFVMCARGVSAVVGVDASIMPSRPVPTFNNLTENSCRGRLAHRAGPRSMPAMHRQDQRQQSRGLFPKRLLHQESPSAFRMAVFVPVILPWRWGDMFVGRCWLPR